MEIYLPSVWCFPLDLLPRFHAGAKAYAEKTGLSEPLPATGEKVDTMAARFNRRERPRLGASSIRSYISRISDNLRFNGRMLQMHLKNRKLPAFCFIVLVSSSSFSFANDFNIATNGDYNVPLNGGNGLNI